MKKISATCVNVILPVFFTTLAIIIWATIFQLPLFPALLCGLAAGTIVGLWYCNYLRTARKNKTSNLRECVHRQITFLSILLFADLFASMLVFSFMELF